MKTYKYVLILFSFLLAITLFGCVKDKGDTTHFDFDSPTGLTAKSGDSMVVLSWDNLTDIPAWAVQDGIKFKIYYGKESGIYDGKDAEQGSSPIKTYSTTFALTGLKNGVTYYFAVTTFSSDLESSFSNEVFATPTASSEPPVLSVIANNPLSFNCVKGENANPQNITIKNTGGGTLTYSYTSNYSWISLAPSSGVINGSSHVIASVGVDCTALSEGIYDDGNLQIKALGTSGSPFDIAIHVTVSSIQQDPEISLSPPIFNLECFQGGGVSDLLNINNSGGGILNWTLSDNAPWLNLNPTFGTAPSAVTLDICCSCVLIGSYTATITVSSRPEIEPKQAIVNLLVKENPPKLEVTPTSLNFYCKTGEIATPQSITIENSGDGSFNYSHTTNYSWISLTPPSGNVVTSVSVDVGADCTSLTPGSYLDGILTVTADAGSIPSVNIAINVTVTSGGSNPPPPPAILSVYPHNVSIFAIWSSVDGATSYKVYWGTQSHSYSNSFELTSISYSIMGLTNGVTYYVAVTAINAEGESDFSVEASAIPFLPPPPPWVHATVGNRSIYLEWGNVDTADSYRVYWGTSSGVYTQNEFIPTLHYNITGLTNGVVYYLIVKSLGGNGDSAPSEEVSATPNADYSIYELLPLHDGDINESNVITDDEFLRVAGPGVEHKSYLKFNFSSMGIVRTNIVEAKITMHLITAHYCGIYPDVLIFSINDYGVLGFEDWNLDLPENGGYNFDSNSFNSTIRDIKFDVPLNVLKDGNNSFLIKGSSAGKLYEFASSSWSEILTKPYLMLRVQNY